MDVSFNSKLPQMGTTIFSVMSALANEHQAINLSQGFPNFDCHDKLKQLVAKHMAEGRNQYAPMPGVLRLREGIATKVKDLYDVAIDPVSEVTITVGATQAIFTTIMAFIKPDDEVILLEPAYDSYRPAIDLAGGRAVSYELTGPDFAIDWDHFKKLINRKTRMIVINTPHNPSASVLNAEDMKNLEKLTANSDILLLSDEVYEHIIFDENKHECAFRYPELRERTIATYSFGKTYHNTGWKLGYCIAPSYLMKEFRKVHQYNVFSVNTPMQNAFADFIRESEHYLSLGKFYQRKRDLFLGAMANSRFKMLQSSGTYYQLADFSEISDEPDMQFAKRLITEFGVAGIPISGFYSSKRDDKIIRFCFAKTDELLLKAGALLSKI